MKKYRKAQAQITQWMADISASARMVEYLQSRVEAGTRSWKKANLTTRSWKKANLTTEGHESSARWDNDRDRAREIQGSGKGHVHGSDGSMTARHHVWYLLRRHNFWYLLRRHTRGLSRLTTGRHNLWYLLRQLGRSRRRRDRAPRRYRSGQGEGVGHGGQETLKVHMLPLLLPRGLGSSLYLNQNQWASFLRRRCRPRPRSPNMQTSTCNHVGRRQGQGGWRAWHSKSGTHETANRRNTRSPPRVASFPTSGSCGPLNSRRSNFIDHTSEYY